MPNTPPNRETNKKLPPAPTKRTRETEEPNQPRPNKKKRLNFLPGQTPAEPEDPNTQRNARHEKLTKNLLDTTDDQQGTNLSSSSSSSSYTNNKAYSTPKNVIKPPRLLVRQEFINETSLNETSLFGNLTQQMKNQSLPEEWQDSEEEVHPQKRQKPANIDTEGLTLPNLPSPSTPSN